MSYDQNAGSEPYKMFVPQGKSSVWSWKQNCKYLWQRTEVMFSWNFPAVLLCKEDSKGEFTIFNRILVKT